MITVACVWVQGHVPFSSRYVANLHKMAWRWVKEPFRFVCLTDRPGDLPKGVEGIAIPPVKRMKGWWAKVNLFNPELNLGDRIVYYDLDTLLVAPQTAVIHYPAPFALVPDGAPNFKGLGNRKTVKNFNSSVMVWSKGQGEKIFTEFNRRVTYRLWGDQDFIGQLYPQAEKMPAEWFPRLSEGKPPQWRTGTKVVLCKKPKNEAAAEQWPWFREMWG